jgi:hypothetical protein
MICNVRARRPVVGGLEGVVLRLFYDRGGYRQPHILLLAPRSHNAGMPRTDNLAETFQCRQMVR